MLKERQMKVIRHFSVKYHLEMQLSIVKLLSINGLL